VKYGTCQLVDDGEEGLVGGCFMKINGRRGLVTIAGWATDARQRMLNPSKWKVLQQTANGERSFSFTPPVLYRVAFGLLVIWISPGVNRSGVWWTAEPQVCAGEECRLVDCEIGRITNGIVHEIDHEGDICHTCECQANRLIGSPLINSSRRVIGLHVGDLRGAATGFAAPISDLID
jgi:hypothetical protein